MNQDLAYRSILDCMDEGVCVLDPQSKILYMNPAAEKLAGRGHLEPVGKPVDEVFCASIAEKVNRLRCEGCSAIEDGIEISLSPFFDEGRGTGSIIFLKKASLPGDNSEKASPKDNSDFARDPGGISLHRQAEEALRKSEKSYREPVEGASCIIMRRDLAGRITFLNKFALEFFGYDEDEITGKNVIGTIVPAIDSEGRDLRIMIDEIGRQPENYAININENIRSNGDRVWIAWANRPILNDKGEIVEIQSIGNDITDRKIAEEKLEAEHERLLRIVEFLPDATFVIDKDKKIIAWNRAIEEMTGVNKEQMIGKGNYIYGQPFYGEPRPMLIDLIDIEDKEIESKYLYVDRKDGKVYAEALVPSLFSGKGAYVWAMASRLYNDKGEVIGSIESIRDITLQMTSAEEIRRRDLLLAGIAAAANALLISQDDESDIDQALEILGLSANVDRIYICENNDPDKARIMSRIFEWCREGIPRQIDNPGIREISFSQNFRSWYKTLETGKIINCSIKSPAGSIEGLSTAEISLLKSQGILSLLIVPITIEGKLWGFVGIDDCRFERIWTQSERSILGMAAASIGEMMARRSVERALQRSEEDYRSLVENINDAIFKLDAQGRFTYMSPVMEVVSGYEINDIIGQDFARFIHPDDLPGLQASFERLMSGHLEPYEFRIKDKRGNFRHVRTSSRILMEKGLPTGFIGVLTDITNRKQAEEKLRETRDYLENLIDYANAPIIVWDPTFRITRFNHAFKRLTGLESAQVLGKPLDILFPDASKDESIDHIKRTLTGERWEAVEIPIRRRDGEVRIVLWNSSNIYEKDGTTVIATIAQGQDITEQKKAQEKIRFQASLLDQVRNGVIATDLDGKIIYWNKFAETLYQWKSDEVIGKSISETIVPEDRVSIVNDVVSNISLSGYSMGEFKARRKDGSIFPAHYTFSVIKDLDDRIIGCLGVSVDITERKHAEEDLRNAKEAAEAATRAKSAFLANMSHEIRTPMNAVIGLTGLILNTELTPDQRDCIETIRTSGETLLALVNDILDFSKIEGGKLELEAKPFDLIDSIEASLDLVAQTAARKGLSLSYSIDESVPNTIISDVTRLRQILANLLSNAVKFTNTGEISVIVSSKREGETNFIQFAVKDTGIGIPRDRMDRLFQSFSQIDTSMTRKYGGTGLGLAISKRLVELMNGSIWVESEEGRGSKFFFTINAKEAPQIFRSELEGRKILVVTEDDSIRKVVIGNLEFWSMQPTAAKSSKGALEAIARDKFDVAILDMQMGGIEDLIRQLHDISHIPIVALGNPKQGENLFATIVSRPVLTSELCDALSKAARKANVGRHMPTSYTGRLPLRILLAEDNIVNQKVGLRMIERLGYHADVAANGIEVLKALERQKYDVILMDIQMPEMDGLETARRIRMHPDGNEIYIIAITAHALKGDRETCFDAGMNDYISKPVRIEDLQNALEQSRSHKS